MAESAELIREFVLSIERTLNARRLYARSSPPHRDVTEKLLEKCHAAALAEPFTIRVGANDLFLDKTSLINRPKREDSFFFPLYRDGLRELTFQPQVSASDLEALLEVFEAKEKKALANEDTVTLLWRSDLTTILHNAIDGIGEIEGDEGEDSKDDFRALISELADRISNTATPVTGQSYAFMVDADVRVAAQDFHFDATTVHKKFEENPAVLRLSSEQATALRAELAIDREQALLERFIDIVLVLMANPAKPDAASTLGPLLQKLIEGYWNGHDFARLVKLLGRLRSVAESAPHPDSRTAAREIIQKFLTPDRIRGTFPAVQHGELTLKEAAQVWSFVGDPFWELLMEFWISTPEGKVREGTAILLRNLVRANPELLRRSLGTSDAAVVRGALTLIDDRMMRLYARELVSLCSHEDEGVRLKGLGYAGRLGGNEALEALWKAMESDPAKPVRLLAFRLVSTSNLPGLAERLRHLIDDPGFGARPVWEREKYVRLLGSIAGEEVVPLFESWIPKKRWLWQPAELETAELALRGIAACGEKGFEQVRVLSESSGKLGEIAKKVFESASKCEVGSNTMMRPLPVPRTN